MKPAVNSSLTKINYGQVATVRAAWWALKIPNYVWLAMILTAATALSLNAMTRESEEVRRAEAARSQTAGRVTQAQTSNQQLKGEVQSLKNDPEVAARAAQERLNYLRPNEIMIATH